MGLGSGIRDLGFWIPDPCVKKAPALGSRTRIRNTTAMQILFVLGDRIRWNCQTEILQHTLLSIFPPNFVKIS